MLSPAELASVVERASRFAPIGQIVIDARQRIVAWNAWMERASKLAAADVLGAPLTEVFDELSPRLVQTLQRALEGPVSAVLSRAFLRHPFPLWNEQFRDRPMAQSVTINGFRDPRGDPYCVISISDVSREAQREALLAHSAAELEHRNEQLDSFARAASHDLRAPLNTIRSFAELLREDLGVQLDATVEEDLRFIIEGVDRMAQMVTAMLELARAERAEASFAEVACDAVVDEVLEQLRAQVESSGAVITRDPLPKVRADAVLLRQVFQNLISNAIKFVRDETPVIHITAGREDERDVIGVRDNGIGVAPDAAERVFAPFERLPGAKDFDGCGIGLSICRRVIAQHGGAIWFDPACDRGSHVRFYLDPPKRAPSPTAPVT
ncbi:MAG: ATP-binding protein [Planctomycetota bacterium]